MKILRTAFWSLVLIALLWAAAWSLAIVTVLVLTRVW